MHSKLNCRLPSQGPRDAQQDQSLSQALQLKRYIIMLHYAKQPAAVTPVEVCFFAVTMSWGSARHKDQHRQTIRCAPVLKLLIV